MYRSLPQPRYNLSPEGFGMAPQPPSFDRSPGAFEQEPSNWPSVSMVTGEVRLRLSDGTLDGPLPFEWTRLYCTRFVDTACDLGFGWSHSLCHHLQRDDDGLLWTDSENRQTRFVWPGAQRPAITCAQVNAAIYLGDTDGELIIAQAGKHCRFFHFQNLKLSAVSDAYGNRLNIDWHLGRLQRIDNGAGRALLLRYQQGLLCAVDYQHYDDSHESGDARGQQRADRWCTLHTLVTYRYNDAGQLTGASNALQETEQYRYDAWHVIQERQLAGGAVSFWTWQHAGKHSRCIHHTTNFGQMHVDYQWDDRGAVTVRHQDGSQHTWVHDANARLVSHTRPGGAEHHYSHDEQGRLIAEKDPAGTLTRYRYNEAGQLSAVIPAHDEPTFYSYLNGHLHKVQRGLACWIYEHNARGDITRQIDPDGNVTTWSYTCRGQISARVLPDGGYHRLTWNRLGQLLDETLPDATQQRYSYDLRGRKTTAQDQYGAITRYQWDALARLSQMILPGGKTRAWSYNAYGKVIAERDERGQITRYEYADNLPLLSSRINPDGSQLNYRYDNCLLLLTSIENERNEHYLLDYHPGGLVRQEVDFDGTKTGYSYDLNGRLLEQIEYPDADYPDQQPLITLYQRDSAGRLLLKTLPDACTIACTYDNLGRLTRVTDGKWPLVYEYDLQDRLITEHQGPAILRYQYDALGQLSACHLPDGNQLVYHYQKGAGLCAIDLNGERLSEHQFEAGREISRQQGNLHSQYRYDQQGRLQEHALTSRSPDHGFGTRPLYSRHYQYDASGNLRLLGDSRHGQQSYSYDSQGRLIAVRGKAEECFEHDPAGNLLRQSASGRGRSSPANVKGNRLLIQGDCHFVYDAYGNLIQERRGAGQRLVRHYRYDCQHRLTAITLPDGSEIQYLYDALGRRIAKQVDDRSTRFVWLGECLLSESSSQKDLPASTCYRSYLYEPGTCKPLALLQGEGPGSSIFHYQLDPFGTPLELTDPCAIIVWSACYRAYGNVHTFDIADISNPLRFQGQYYDDESGLHYHRHRYYNPSTGRYLSPDPLKLAAGLNSYRYEPVLRQGWRCNTPHRGINNRSACNTGTAPEHQRQHADSVRETAPPPLPHESCRARYWP